MSDPNAVTSPMSTNFLDDAPGGDIPFSELFGSEGGSPEQATTPATESTPAPEPVQPSQAASVFEPIRTRTGSVYNTADAVTRGIEEKDTLIRQLRERYVAERGVDPITNQPVSRAEEPVNYMRDPQRFARDLAAAASKNDAAAYTNTQTKLIFDALQPIAPIIQEFSKSRANEMVTKEIAEFAAFRSSPDFNRVLDSSPVLKQAVNGAEQDINFSAQLPELYKLVYSEYTRQRMPELLKAVQTQNTPITPPQTSNRSMTSGTMTPVTPTTSASDADALQTKEGRAELMNRLRAQGIDKVVW